MDCSRICPARPLYKAESPPNAPPGGMPGRALGLRPFGPEMVYRTVSETGLTPQWGGRRAPPCKAGVAFRVIRTPAI